MARDELAVIAWDESGAEGENLMASTRPDFVHGSVHLATEKAAQLLDALRGSTGSRTAELKSKTVLSRVIEMLLSSSCEA